MGCCEVVADRGKEPGPVGTRLTCEGACAAVYDGWAMLVDMSDWSCC